MSDLSGSMLKAVSPSATEASPHRGIIKTCPEASKIYCWGRPSISTSFLCYECNLFSAEDFGKYIRLFFKKSYYKAKIIPAKKIVTSLSEKGSLPDSQLQPAASLKAMEQCRHKK